MHGLSSSDFIHQFLPDKVLDYVQQSKSGRPLPDGTVLDLNLSGTDGREVVAEIKLDHELKMIPIVVLTPSSNSKDVETCYPSGVNSYSLKAMY